MSAQTLLENLDPLFKENGWYLPNKEWGLNLVNLIGPSMVLINDGVNQAKPFFEEPRLHEDGKKQLEIKEAQEVLKFILDNLKKLDSSFISEKQALDLVNQATKNCEVKKGLVMKSLRAALHH
jgi:glutamyl-tRNA synthetase